MLLYDEKKWIEWESMKWQYFKKNTVEKSEKYNFTFFSFCSDHLEKFIWFHILIELIILFIQKKFHRFFIILKHVLMKTDWCNKKYSCVWINTEKKTQIAMHVLNFSIFFQLCFLPSPKANLKHSKSEFPPFHASNFNLLIEDDLMLFSLGFTNF